MRFASSFSIGSDPSGNEKGAGQGAHLGSRSAARVVLKKIDGTVWGEWRGNGQTVIKGRHPNGNQYRQQVAKPAAEIEFDSIVWPADVVLPWKEKEQPPPPSPELKTSPQDLDKRISGYVDAIPGAISDQAGHAQTFKVACKLVNGWSLSAAEAMPYLQGYNQRCEPPWTDNELAHKLADAEKEEHKEPRGISAAQRASPMVRQTVRPPTATEVAKRLDILYDLVGSEAEILAGQYHSNIKPNAVLATVSAFEVRYDLPVVFVPTAKAGARLVERWAFYFARETVAGRQQSLAGRRQFQNGLTRGQRKELPAPQPSGHIGTGVSPWLRPSKREKHTTHHENTPPAGHRTPRSGGYNDGRPGTDRA